MLAAPPTSPCSLLFTGTHHFCSKLRRCVTANLQKWSRQRQVPKTQTSEATEVSKTLAASLKSSNPPPKFEPVQAESAPPSQPGSYQSWANSKTQEQEEEGDEEEEERIEGRRIGLSGSDVLMALQRATLQNQKGRFRSKKKQKSFNMKNNRRLKRGDEDDVDTEDYSNVRPLNIKGDWEIRLNQCEIRLQELLHNKF